jgi:hypothetical protein
MTLNKKIEAGDIVLSNVNTVPLTREGDKYNTDDEFQYLRSSIPNGFKVGHVRENHESRGIGICFSPTAGSNVFSLNTGVECNISGGNYARINHDEIRLIGSTTRTFKTLSNSDPMNLNAKEFEKKINIWAFETNVNRNGYERHTDNKLLSLLNSPLSKIVNYLKDNHDASNEAEKISRAAALGISGVITPYNACQKREVWGYASIPELCYYREFKTDNDYTTWLSKYGLSLYQPEWGDIRIDFK